MLKMTPATATNLLQALHERAKDQVYVEVKFAGAVVTAKLLDVDHDDKTINVHWTDDNDRDWFEWLPAEDVEAFDL